jgi:hypothetical protein
MIKTFYFKDAMLKADRIRIEQQLKNPFRDLAAALFLYCLNTCKNADLVEMVHPRTWRAELKLPTRATREERKTDSVALCEMLLHQFDDKKQWLDYWAKKYRSHDMAESFLMTQIGDKPRIRRRIQKPGPPPIEVPPNTPIAIIEETKFMDVKN